MSSAGSTDEGLHQQISLVVQQMLDQRQPFINELYEMTLVEVSALDNDTRMRALLEASITENIVSAVYFLDNGTDIKDLEAPSAALSYARTLAQRDVPLSALIRAYRIGHARFLDVALGLVDTAPSEHQMALVLHFVRRSAEYIDKVCEQVGRSYEAERDRWVSSRSGLRQQAVNQVLQGTSNDITQVEELLSYAFDGTHVAVEAWPEPDVVEFDVVKLFDDVRKVIGDRLRAIGPPLLVPNDEREVRLWFPVPDGTPVVASDLIAALAASGLAVHLAVGDALSGVDGFRQSLRQAERVKGIKLAAGSAAPSVVTYVQVAPVALMAADLNELRRFVTSQLGRLAVDDERSQTLRETLRVFLDRNRSYSGAAQTMMLHRNSIQYRVQQAMEACGKDLDEPAVGFELHAALVAAQWLGASVLTRA